jgi:alkylhydroperoxidase family enzyme
MLPGREDASRGENTEVAVGSTNSGLPPLPVDRWSDAAREILPRFLRRPQLYLSGDPDAPPMPQALGLFAHHVELAEAWMSFTDVLAAAGARLDPRYRELAILRVAWRTRSEYEWRQHTRIALGTGLTTEHLYAIPEGPGSALWTPLERAIVDAVDQIVDSSCVDGPTWEALAGPLDEAQLLELLFVIGGYVCFASVANSARLTPDPPTEPVDAPPLPARVDG